MTTSNTDLLIYVDGRLLRRPEARVSVFDASFQSGDAVWEGLRVYDGRVFELEAHLDRLYDSAKALAIQLSMPRAQLADALFTTLRANGLYDDAHVRLMVTRGERRTSGMDPRNTLGGPSVIIIAEHKPPIFDKKGVRLITSSVRRPSPDTLDCQIHHANQLNSILAKIEANRAGVDDAIMLDQHGFVAETNSTNIFVVKRGELSTPFTHACVPGITRGLVIQLARSVGIPTVERNMPLLEVHTADEVFLSGTIGEIVPVVEVDGRATGAGAAGPITERVSELYRGLTGSKGVRIPATDSATETTVVKE